MSWSLANLLGLRDPAPGADSAAPAAQAVTPGGDIEIAPNDPLLAYLESSDSAVQVERLSLDSPGLAALRAAGVRLVVPLVTQGELIGTLNLGSRLSEQEYSGEDRRLLERLAGQVAPAIRVAQLVRDQQAEVRTRERFEQELRVAQVIQQHFLPREAPELPGWRLAGHYQPAREVGGDFYDFIPLPDGRLGIAIGDVTDKGVPAALVMTATRSVLRAAAQRLGSPGQVLERTNDLLCPDIPPKMFATCLYGVLDATSGRLVYANAGHSLPYMRTSTGVVELEARGMPLGLLPEMTYEEREVVIDRGECVLLHSDGLAEAHSAEGEMFGLPRLQESLASLQPDDDLISALLAELPGFVGSTREPEDDITLVTLYREADGSDRGEGPMGSTDAAALLADFTVPSAPGNERMSIERVVAVVDGLGLPVATLDRLRTAVGEATMNAMEHGNRYAPELPVRVRVLANAAELYVEISDRGGTEGLASELSGAGKPPDLDAKLAGEQTPRGWGLFLIRHMVDEVRTRNDGELNTVELVIRREGGTYVDGTV